MWLFGQLMGDGQGHWRMWGKLVDRLEMDRQIWG